MSGFLYGLVARTLGKANIVRPRPVPRFTPMVGDLIERTEEAGIGRPTEAGGAARNPPEVLSATTIAQHDRYHSEEARRTADRGIFTQAPAEVAEPTGEESVNASRSSKDARADEASRRSAARLETDSVTPARARVAAGTTAPGDAPRAVAQYSDTIARARNDANAQRLPGRRDGVTRMREPPIADPVKGVDGPDRNEHDAALPLAEIVAGPRLEGRALTRDRSSPARAGEPAIGASTVDPAHADQVSNDEAAIVNVTIGRIEVRSHAEPSVRIVRREVSNAPPPRDQLDSYLRARRNR